MPNTTKQENLQKIGENNDKNPFNTRKEKVDMQKLKEVGSTQEEGRKRSMSIIAGHKRK